MSLRKGAFGKNYLNGVSVLKKLTMAAILSVKIDGMPGKQPYHQGGHPGTATSK
jgi:hypothetical protein